MRIPRHNSEAAASIQAASEEAVTANIHTPPTLASPPRSKTPPLQRSAQAKRNQSNTNNGVAGHSERSDAVDATALSIALKEFEDAGRQRERTPGGSPSRKRQRVYGDRSVGHFFFIYATSIRCIWLEYSITSLHKSARVNVVALRAVKHKSLQCVQCHDYNFASVGTN
jgi:hypothetical protein